MASKCSTIDSEIICHESLNSAPYAISKQSCDSSSEPKEVPLRVGLEAEPLGAASVSDRVSVSSIRQLLEQTRAGKLGLKLEEYNSKLHQHLVLQKGQRPKKGAQYMAPQCRLTPDGAGGAPLSRPSSAPIGGRGRRAKTERWRESGIHRWPKEHEKIQQPSDPSDGDPLRRSGNEQPSWCQELWVRSLRRPGLDMQDLVYSDAGQRGVRELHEEWVHHGQSQQEASLKRWYLTMAAHQDQRLRYPRDEMFKRGSKGLFPQANFLWNTWEVDSTLSKLSHAIWNGQNISHWSTQFETRLSCASLSCELDGGSKAK
eukprot:CAMPEP_0169219580 /NCGR_PEP_ID=MMETSP1016-20121227/20051_1 /TAXON_ID=342587 /ORGANISM="Karlodinium micrum, Strain CCMP2283" /LENGTH=314 /DNA_ID=CAMNT_0009297651 /DNA_START=153 /DNA_END=1095 /DNA_ORIENTATION=+